MRVELQHPVFEQPADANATIWRYMRFSKFISLLHSQSLYFYLLSKLPDQAEGRLPRRHLCEWDPGLVVACEHQRNITAINCWHMRDDESVNMWQSYCGLAEGIAIRSSYARLVSCFRSVPGTLSDQQEIAIGMVKYLDFDRDLLQSNNAFAPIMCKRKAFEDDREVRAVVFPDWFLESAFEQGALDGICMPVDLKTLIEAIVVAPEAPNWILLLVKSIAGGQFEVRRSTVALCRRPATVRELDLVKRIETKAQEIRGSGRSLDDSARHELFLAALGSVIVFQDHGAFLAHQNESEFVHQYVEWLLNNPPVQA